MFFNKNIERTYCFNSFFIIFSYQHLCHTVCMKSLLKIIEPREKHWVGDGFYVSTLFSIGSEDYRHITPFLMLDHAHARHFPPTNKKRGVGEHPHRGFETVTFAVKGEITHRDSGGGGGTIKTGGVQWMSAAAGVVHDEFHSPAFSKEGGEFEMVQLWVNLPAKDKMNKPSYQSLEENDFPTTRLAEGKAAAKVVAGELNGVKGPAKTYTPISMYMLEAKQDCETELNFSEGSNLLLLQLERESSIENKNLRPNHIAMFSRDGKKINLSLSKGSKVLVLNGEPIDEPVANYGPFVMNTREEIAQAIDDYQSGKMGRLPREV